MTIRVAINGFGRIGRNVLRALYEAGDKYADIEVVAINDLAAHETNAHLLQYDTAHGKFFKKVGFVESGDEHFLSIDDDKIAVYQIRSPEQLPWAELNVDVVMECTGVFNSKASASAHIQAGAKKVIISAPGKDVDATIVYGVNHTTLTNDMTVISNASCTTNCLAPVAQVLDDTVGIESGLMTTIHAFTNDQVLTDVAHSDLRRARAAAYSMIPTKTGAAAAVGLVLPALNGKLDGLAVRVPLLNVSLVDLSFIAKKDTSTAEINAAMHSVSQNRLAGVLGYNDEPLVSIDFNHNPLSSIFDASETRVSGRLVKVMAWYDNEWGFSNRMLDNAKYWASL